MISTFNLPNEIIIEISQCLPLKSAIAFSCTNRRLYAVLEYVRHAGPLDYGILERAVKNQRDPAAIRHIINRIRPAILHERLSIVSVALKYGNARALKVLCGENFLNIYEGDTRQRYVMIILNALLQGHELALEQFIELCPNCLRNALVGAAAGGSVRLVRRLIDYGADINAAASEISLEWDDLWKGLAIAKNNRLCLTPLVFAAAKGHLEVVQLLIQHGVVVGVRDESGKTPLCWAARHGKHEVVRLFLNMYSADDVQGPALEALAVAGIHNQSEVILLLWNILTPKPEPDLDNAKWLILAATICQDITLLLELCELGYGDSYEIHHPPSRDPAIMAAIKKHNLDIFKLLLDRLAYSHEMLPDFLSTATKEQDEAIVSYLLSRVNVAEFHPYILVPAAPSEAIFRRLLNAGGDQGVLPQFTEHWISKGLVHVMEALLSDPGYQLDEHMGEPIIVCAVIGGKRMFEYLLKQHQWDEELSPHGPSADLAIQMALFRGHLDLLQILLEQGFPYVSEHELLLMAFNSGSRLIYLCLPVKTPRQADLSQEFAIGWRLMDKNGITHKSDRVFVRAGRRKLRCAEQPFGQSMPPVLSEESTLEAMRKNPTMGSVWVVHYEDKSLAFIIDSAHPERSFYFESFYEVDIWDRTAEWLRTPDLLRIENFCGY
ncbi:ankyrin repeat-containing domain protein [Aspergillus californicus]